MNLKFHSVLTQIRWIEWCINYIWKETYHEDNHWIVQIIVGNCLSQLFKSMKKSLAAMKIQGGASSHYSFPVLSLNLHSCWNSFTSLTETKINGFQVILSLTKVLFFGYLNNKLSLFSLIHQLNQLQSIEGIESNDLWNRWFHKMPK